MNSDGRKNEGDILRGETAIEKFMGHSYVTLTVWREAYQFPMKKIAGLPQLSIKEFESWGKDHGVGGLKPADITEKRIDDYRRKKDIDNAVKSRFLETLQDIADFTGHPVVNCMDWANKWTGCPIKKEGRKYSCDSKALVIWMRQSGIGWGHGRETFAL